VVVVAVCGLEGGLGGGRKGGEEEE